MGVNNKTLFAIIIVIVLAFGAVYMFGIPTSGGITGGALGGGATQGGASIYGPCGSTNQGELRFGAVNPLNTSNAEYEAITARVYKLDGANEIFDGTISTTAGQAYQTAASGYDCQCGTTYKIYFPASDGTSTSRHMEMTCSGPSVTTKTDGSAAVMPIPQQTGLVFKVYDNDAKKFVFQGSTETTAGSWAASTATYYDTSANGTTSTGTTVGTGGYVDFSIYFEVNGTLYDDRQFNDQGFMIGFDLQDKSDWSDPATVEIAGITMTKMSECPSKIANDGYDVCYEATSGLSSITNSPNLLHVIDYGKSGVNPTDDIKVGFFTPGYYVSKTGEVMKMGFNKDDSSETSVFTVQHITLSIA